MYYRLDKFYINHRSFAKSRHYAQLRGEDVDGPDDADACYPIKTNKELLEGGWVKPEWISNYEAISSKPDQLAWPCGFIAKYLFNDKFTWIADTEGKVFNVTIDDSNIAHEVDTDTKFKRNEDAFAKGDYWTDIED